MLLYLLIVSPHSCLTEVYCLIVFISCHYPWLPLYLRLEYANYFSFEFPTGLSMTAVSGGNSYCFQGGSFAVLGIISPLNYFYSLCVCVTAWYWGGDVTNPSPQWGHNSDWQRDSWARPIKICASKPLAMLRSISPFLSGLSSLTQGIVFLPHGGLLGDCTFF